MGGISINFWTPVVSSDTKKGDKLNAVLQAAESYFDVGSKRYRIEKLSDGNASVTEDKSQCTNKKLKIASYCTVIVPLAMLLVKGICRAKYSFCDMSKYNVKTVISHLRKLQSEGKKLGVVIGKKASESLPKEDGITWVSLDREVLGKGSVKKGRLHLKLNHNEQKDMDQIRKLFDKVVVDAPTWKTINETGSPLGRFHSIMTPEFNSELIIQPHIVAIPDYESRSPTYGIHTVKVPSKRKEDNETAKTKRAAAVDVCKSKLKDKLVDYFKQTEIREGASFPYKSKEKYTGYIVAKNPRKNVGVTDESEDRPVKAKETKKTDKKPEEPSKPAQKFQSRGLYELQHAIGREQATRSKKG
jgi:hypothetical protein